MSDLQQIELFDLPPETEGPMVPRSKQFPVMSTADMKTLAKDIATGKVFMDIFLKEQEVGKIGHLIFMPMMFMDWSDWTDEDKAQFGAVYEYFDKAGPRSINGYPIFFSCRFIHRDDLRVVWRMAQKIQKTLDNF